MRIELAGTEHQGQLVVQYRKAMHWSQQDLGEALRVDLRTVQRMEQQAVIKSVKRRQLLVGLLGIPAMLLGLEGERQTLTTHLVLNDDNMAFLEYELATRWDVYHTGGTIRAYRGLDIWLKKIEDFARQSQGNVWHERAYSSLCLSYQLQGSIFRDMMEYNQAHIFYDQAFVVAKEMNDRELMAASLARRGVTCIQQSSPMEAIEHLNEALRLVNGLGLPCLRGYILQALSEAYAIDQQASQSQRSIELAQRALDYKGEVLERSNCFLNTTSVTAQKGVNAVWLHDNERAVALIDKGLANYDPTLVRGRARLLAQKAEAYYGLGFVDMSVTTAEEALTLARPVGSHKTIARIESLHTNLAQSRWRKESSVARLGALLS